jgi:hypothetical protein
VLDSIDLASLYSDPKTKVALNLDLKGESSTFYRSNRDNEIGLKDALGPVDLPMQMRTTKGFL